MKTFLLLVFIMLSFSTTQGVNVKEGKKAPGAGEAQEEKSQLRINVNTFDYSSYHARSFHKNNGVNCELCHKVIKPKSRANSTSCSWCHGAPELMATFTSDMEPNPHDSPHYGADLGCTQCHHQHKDSELFCSQCHEFGYTVP